MRQGKKLAWSLAIRNQQSQFKEQNGGYDVCPRCHARVAPLLGPGPVAERSVAAADTNRVHLPWRAEGLVPGGGYQTRCRRRAGFAIHDSCDTEQRLLSLMGTPFCFTTQFMLENCGKTGSGFQSSAGDGESHLGWATANSAPRQQQCTRSRLGFFFYLILVGTKKITNLIYTMFIKRSIL